MRIYARDIKNSSFSNFYKPLSRTVTPHFALFFFEIYKQCSDVQKLLETKGVAAALENAVLNYFIDDEARKLIGQLTVKYINEQFKTGTAINSLSEQVDKSINELNKKLGIKWKNSVDRCYKLISSFIWLVTFDYYALLKNINGKLIEYAFEPAPSFAKTPATKIIEPLKDFLAVAEGVDFEADWSIALAVIHNFGQKADVLTENRNKILSRIKNVTQSRIFHMIIRHATCDPNWKNRIIVPRKMIAGAFLNDVISTARKTLHAITVMEKDNAINRCILSIFGPAKIPAGAKYYTEACSAVYEGTGNNGFKYTTVFNYCIVFMDLYFEKLKSICDTFIIYGNWSNTDDMHDLSQCLHELTILNEQLLQYDKTLSPYGEHGSKLKYLEINSVRSRAHRNSLFRYIVSINDEVLTMIDRLSKTLFSLYTFLTKLKTGDEAELVKEIVNAQTVYAMLKDNGSDIIFAEEKTASFLHLLNHLGLGRFQV